MVSTSISTHTLMITAIMTPVIIGASFLGGLTAGSVTWLFLHWSPTQSIVTGTDLPAIVNDTLIPNCAVGISVLERIIILNIASSDVQFT